MRRRREAARTFNVEEGKNRERAGGANAPEMVLIARGGNYSNNRIGPASQGDRYSVSDHLVHGRDEVRRTSHWQPGRL
jgi:hypothetical protein